MILSAIRTIRSFVFQVLVTMIFLLAFGSFTYFFLRQFTTFMNSPETQMNDSKSFIPWVIISNGTRAISIVLIVRLVALFDDKIKRKWMSYGLLCILIFFCDDLIFTILRDYRTFIKSLFHISALGMIFETNTLLSGIIIYRFMNIEKEVTQRFSDQQFQLLQLKELKTKAELEALQAKVNPHFLYNSLNSIASLIHEDPEKAEQMVLLLSKFFRYSTNAKSQYMTRLIDEIEMVKTYLEVEKVRFDEKLEYSIWFQNDKIKDCLVPQFLIQPLVENAIKHGTSKITGKGILGIRILEKKDDKLQIIIFDNGEPFPIQINTGYGLRSTQDKLRLLMGEDAKMEIYNGKGSVSTGQEFKETHQKYIKISMKQQYLPVEIAL